MVPALVDRLGDSKDQVREQSQALILRCMEQTASPMVSTHTDIEILEGMLLTIHNYVYNCDVEGKGRPWEDDVRYNLPLLGRVV